MNKEIQMARELFMQLESKRKNANLEKTRNALIIQSLDKTRKQIQITA